MKNLRTMLRVLTGAGVSAVVVLTAISLAEGFAAQQATARALVAKDVTADILPPPLYMIELRLVLSQAVEGTLTLDQARMEAARLEKEYRNRIDHWSQRPPFGLESDLLGAQHQAGQKLIDSVAPVLDAMAAGDATTARNALRQAHTTYLAHRQGVNTTVQTASAFAEDALHSLERVQRVTERLNVLVFVVSAVVLVLLGWWVRRSVQAATGGEPFRAAEIAQAVAQGDLSVAVPVQRGDQRSVMAALEHMCSSLSTTVAKVRACSESIATGTQQIAQGNNDLSARTESQASTLEQTAASMEELNSTVHQNAENARRANLLARDASEIATRSGSAVEDMVRTIQEIEQSSRRIADIIGVIDGIAFQTNILALNAAVEAARAGEQGRGFAVVASEVRSLAQRSATAAREIRSLIDSSVEKVSQGVAQAGRAGSSMTDAVSAIGRVSELVATISAASAEQSIGVAQIGEAVNQLDHATQQNAALVEQSAAAASSLHAQAEDLVLAVSAFRSRHAAGMPLASLPV